jgi:tetratricopeptide (TPR) repeat protein
MGKIAGIVILAFLSLAAMKGFGADAKGGADDEIAATQEGISGLAQNYLMALEPKLEVQDRRFLDEYKNQVFLTKGMGFKFDEAIGDMVSSLALKLASAKSIPAITAASAFLVTVAPKSPRTANLLGSVLHASGKFKESIPVLEYTLSLSPKSTIAMINLANACLDADKDAKAKSILDKALWLEPDNKSVYRALAAYYWKKKEMEKFKDCLVKGAKFGGLAKKKVKPRRQKIANDKVEPEDNIETMKLKTAALEEAVPLTTADLIEDDDPDAAQKIRDQYGKLIDGERMVMPKFPQMKMNTNQDYLENFPIVEAWVGVFAERAEKYAVKTLPEGVDPNAGEEVLERQAEKAAGRKMTEAMQNAERMLKMMEGMPGLEAADEKELREAMIELKKVAGKEHVKLAGDSEDEESQDGEAGAGSHPFFDSGSIFAEANYEAYVMISNSHELYMDKLIKDYREKEKDIFRVYSVKVSEEKSEHDQLWQKLSEEHTKSLQEASEKSARSGGIFISEHDSSSDIPCRKEKLRHAKAMNLIGNNYYQQWANLYVPFYTQQMKPALEGYWRVSTLYIKNMNDPKVMKREYFRVLSFLSNNMVQASGAAGNGGVFKYMGSTEEEEESLQNAIRAAEAAAEAELPKFHEEFEEPTTDWEQWVIDHLVVEVKIGVLGLKVTAKTIEFDAWLGGVSAGFKASPIDGKLDTYTGVGGKFSIGLNVCGAGGKIEGKGDVFRKTAHFDFDNGTYSESYSTATGEIKGSLGPATGSLKIDVDPELNANLSGKYSLTAAKYDN